MNAIALIPIILVLQASYFDMQGTVLDVQSPSTLTIGNDTVNETITLDGVDASDLNHRQYSYLMNDIKPMLLGKSVFIKGGNVYFDLTGSYNSRSINEMINSEVEDLMAMRRYFCEGFCDSI